MDGLEWHQMFHPVHVGTFALVFTAALTSALHEMPVGSLARWERDGRGKDHAAQSAGMLLAGATSVRRFFISPISSSARAGVADSGKG
jgi:hypothetical protein